MVSKIRKNEVLQINLIFKGIVRILRQQLSALSDPLLSKLRQHLPDPGPHWTIFQNDLPSFSRNLPTRPGALVENIKCLSCSVTEYCQICNQWLHFVLLLIKLN